MATSALVLSHFAIFALVALAFRLRPEAVVEWYANLGLVPAELNWYAPLTYSFLHEDVFHLSANMLVLWVFGSSVEDALRWRRFLLVYGAAAVATGLVEVAMARVVPGADRLAPIVGASGAASALVGVFAVRFYRSRISLVGLPVRVPAVLLLSAVLLAEMGWVLWRLVHHGASQPVAHWAHIAGFALGLLWAHASRMHQAGRREYLESDAEAEIERGAPLSAARRWEAVLATAPDDLQARAELGRAWGEAGDREQCLSSYREAISGYLRQGNRVEAAARYKQMVGFYADAPLPASERFAVAGALEQRHEHHEAERAFEALVREAPRAPEAEMARLRIGVLLLKRLGRPHSASEALRQFVECYPGSEWRDYAEELLREAEQKREEADQGGP